MTHHSEAGKGRKAPKPKELKNFSEGHERLYGKSKKIVGDPKAKPRKFIGGY